MTLYFDDTTSADGNWGNPLNWWENAAATVPAGIAPWLADDVTKGYDLTRSTANLAAGTNVNIATTIGQDFEITGICDIGYVAGGGYGTLTNNIGSIYGGTFTGDGLTNNIGSIYGGSFTGDGFTNIGYIYGGTFMGDGLTNNSESYIYGGTFTGDGFTNSVSSYIYGGTFTGDGLTNSGGSIYGGTLTGDGFTNSGGYIYGGTLTGDGFTNTGFIYGGTFTGDGFTNSSESFIYGGTFTGDGFTNSGSGYIYGYENSGYGVFFYASGNLAIEGGPTIRCRFSLASGTIDFNAANGISLCHLSSDILGAGLL